jgi:hypothetical protein
MNASIRSERLILIDPTDPRIRQWATASDQFTAALMSPDLIAVLIFCSIGLLVTSTLLLAIPDFGEMSASFQQFP